MSLAIRSNKLNKTTSTQNTYNRIRGHTNPQNLNHVFSKTLWRWGWNHVWLHRGAQKASARGVKSVCGNLLGIPRILGCHSGLSVSTFQMAGWLADSWVDGWLTGWRCCGWWLANWRAGWMAGGLAVSSQCLSTLHTAEYEHSMFYKYMTETIATHCSMYQFVCKYGPCHSTSQI